MSKDQIFKFRLDEVDRIRLDALAKHYSASAGTVVRILVNEKARELGLTDEEPRKVPKKRATKN